MKNKIFCVIFSLFVIFGSISCNQHVPSDETVFTDKPIEAAPDTLQVPTQAAIEEHLESDPVESATPVFSCEGDNYTKELVKAFSSPNSKTPFFPYLDDPCEYQEKQFGEGKSAPGTVVMPIMFHSISDNCVRDSDGSCVTDVEFYELMDALVANGFEAISAEEFTGFLYENKKIPNRSVLLIADDRRNGIYFETFFKPYYEDYGWPVISAYIASNSLGMRVTEENAALEKQGWVDHQAHGAFHNIPITNWRWDAEVNGMNAYKYIENEITYPIEFFNEYFNKTPVLFVWPGGGYTEYAAGVVKENGYKAAFTINQRGPIFFNAVPLSDEYTLNVPLFVLPRYWSYNAITKIDEILAIQADAEAYFKENRDILLGNYCACLENK